jgi:hypothetical protein
MRLARARCAQVHSAGLAPAHSVESQCALCRHQCWYAPQAAQRTWSDGPTTAVAAVQVHAACSESACSGAIVTTTEENRESVSGCDHLKCIQRDITTSQRAEVTRSAPSGVSLSASGLRTILPTAAGGRAGHWQPTSVTALGGILVGDGRVAAGVSELGPAMSDGESGLEPSELY